MSEKNERADPALWIGRVTEQAFKMLYWTHTIGSDRPLYNTI